MKYEIITSVGDTSRDERVVRQSPSRSSFYTWFDKQRELPVSIKLLSIVVSDVINVIKYVSKSVIKWLPRGLLDLIASPVPLFINLIMSDFASDKFLLFYLSMIFSILWFRFISLPWFTGFPANGKPFRTRFWNAVDKYTASVIDRAKR